MEIEKIIDDLCLIDNVVVNYSQGRRRGLTDEETEDRALKAVSLAGVTLEKLIAERPLKELGITELCKKAHQNAKEKGFWQDYRALECFKCHGQQTYKSALNNAIGNRLMLIVSEVGEALEALRQGDQDGFKEELADVAIRLGDLCGGLGIDLEAEIIKKMEKNKDRPSLHGKAF